MSNTPEPKFVTENQRQRWVKYGLNVAVAVVVVIALAVAVSYLAEKFSRRVDTTASGMYSLKPQTVNLIKDLKQKVKLVSLYAAKTARDEDNPYAGPVQDLLEEYARKSGNIEYQVIDPVKQPAMTDALVTDAISKYGGAVTAYRGFVESFGATLDQLKQLAMAEAAALADVKTESLGQDTASQNAAAIVNTIRESIPQGINRIGERVDRAQKTKFPDYKALVDTIHDGLTSISKTEAAIVNYAGTLKEDSAIPQPIRQYLAQSQPRLEAIKKLADETVTKIDSLGELKVGELQQAIKGQNLILVLGESDWRVIEPEKVWIEDSRDLRSFADGQELKPRFAGEQAVTTAILSLTSQTKPKVAFIRTGGPPLTDPGMPPFQRGGPFSEIADRLRGYNFDVIEKDISGMYAMQAQMQGRPAAPEPSDEEIKNAIWVVLNTPSAGPPNPTGLGPRLAEHLRNGGAAMVLGMPQAEALTEVLKEYGVEMVTDVAIVHEVPTGDRARSNDWSEEVQRVPIVFVLNNYGQHLLTQPMQSLDSLLAWGCPVRTTPTPGVTITPLLPVPEALKTWGERNIEGVSGGEDPKYDSSGPDPDLPPPFNAGAAVEKDKTRLVVIGGLQSFSNQVINWPDTEMLKRGVIVNRFPGNGELFANSIFWLARMEPMIAISPAAMQVSRISDMSPTTLAGWRFGVLLILLPGLVLAAGTAMYVARKN